MVCYGYLSPVKRTSNEAVGTLDRVETLVPLFLLAWYGLDGWWSISTGTGLYCRNAFYNCNRSRISRIIVNLVVLFSLDASLRCFHLLIYFSLLIYHVHISLCWHVLWHTLDICIYSSLILFNLLHTRACVIGWLDNFSLCIDCNISTQHNIVHHIMIDPMLLLHTSL